MNEAPPLGAAAAASTAAASPPLRRDASGRWADLPLAIRVLQLVDPLIVRAMVEPLASHALHLPVVILAPPLGGGSSAGGGAGGMFSAVKSLGIGLAGGAGGEQHGGRRDAEASDTLCDVVTRLLLLVLAEGRAQPDALDGFDAARQLQEMLLCAACWCRKPTADDEALGEPTAGGGGNAGGGGGGASMAAFELSAPQQASHLGFAVSRLVQAWASSEQMVPLIAPTLHGLLHLAATPEELTNWPCLASNTPASKESMQTFVTSFGSWRSILLREPFLGALRQLEATESPSRVASERWAARQRELVSQEDRMQREQRGLAERIHKTSTRPRGSSPAR